MMLNLIAVFLTAAAVIVVAGVFLAKYADEIAEATGLGRLLVGSILLAGATSLPELSVDTNAILIGQPDLAVGDLFGSCLCNLLILALLDLTRYSRGRLLSPRAAAHALSGLMCIVLCSVAVLAILTRPPQHTAIGLGLGTLAIIVVYVGGARLVYFDQRIASRGEPGGVDQANREAEHAKPSLSRASIGFAVAAIVIVIASPSLAHAADGIAEATGLARSFVGTTLVALSTSLPELVASIAALKLGAYDLAIGNVFGSNSFNIAMLAYLDVVQSGPLLNAIAPIHAITGVAVILVTAVTVAGQLYRVEARVRMLEPEAYLVLVLALGALGIVYLHG
jgi:cation:H+ antiporter